VRRVLEQALPGLNDLAKQHAREAKCGCHQALAHAVMTTHELMPPERLEALQPIIGKYVGAT
jgi:bacterioferritin-associated ferredoxin